MGVRTIPELFADKVKEQGTRLLFQRRDGWSWKQITWLDFDREVKNIASYLMDIGFHTGDKAVIASSNNLDAIATEIAIFQLGAAIVPLPQESTSDEIINAANKLGSKIVFVEDENLLDDMVQKENELTSAEKIVFFSDIRIKHEKIINFKLVLKSGLMKRKKLHDDLQQASSEVSPDNIAALFIDSQGDITAQVNQGVFMDILSEASEKYSQIGIEDQSFSYMTKASPFAKIINYLTFFLGTRAAVAESRKDFYVDILEVMPTILFETKDGLEAIYEKSMSDLNGSSREEKIRHDLGDRIKYIFTDVLPKKEVQTLLKGSGISFLEVPELNGLAD
ncbi:MAG: AMP-binding protein [Thermodesulfobacteriota bacterium]